jgi:MAE_28990/MAE_18760-like HEPN
VNEDLVNTKANLSFEAFTDICLICSIPTKAFAEKREFLVVFLLKRRNSIAHGEDTFVGMEDLDDLTNETIALMRTFGDALENHIYLKTYRSA